MKFTVTIELEHVSGPEQDADTMLDCFAGTIGQQNAARHPLHLTWGDSEFDPDNASVYFVKLVDDAV
jgi:hypothetical protein